MSSQTATILMTDVVASTELRTRLGEEQAERLRRQHDRLVKTAVEVHGGVVVKGLGDGMLARFAEAGGAVAAATAIEQAAEAHSREHPDTPLAVRVGMSAGDVTVEDGDCFGVPVIEAARLCAAADGGQILAADVVRVLTRGRGGHRFVAAGELELKGLPEPVATVEIDWPRAASGAGRLPVPTSLAGAGPALGFAGRASEIDLLGRAWKEAAAGERRSVLVGGEPGVGKTRLAAEFARRVHDELGGALVYGRCDEGLGVPYEPFVEALSFFCQHTPVDGLRSRLGRYPGELARLLPDLPDLVPGLDPPLHSDPETEQYRLFEAVASWLTAAAAAAGLLLVVDDLHWAPAATLQMLAHILRRTDPARLLVIATYRDTEVGDAEGLAALLAELRRTPGTARIALVGLTIDDVAELVKGAPRADTEQALAVRLQEETKGNPFFVGEILRHLAEHEEAADALPVPEGVREVIVSRVDRLGPATGDLLGVAAVLGRNLEVGLLAEVAGVDEEAVVMALDDALAARLVDEVEIGVYRFSHDLVRAALCGALSANRRVRLHRRTADAIEAHCGDLARIAHHLLAGAPLGGEARTAAACRAAGERALAALANAEAARWFSEGLAFADGAEDPPLRVDLLIGLGEAQRRIGDTASRQTLLDASDLALAHGDLPRLVRAVLANSRGVASVVGFVDEERLRFIGAVLELLGPAQLAERADLLSVQALELVFAGDHRRVLEAADEAASIAAGLDDLTLRARVGMRRLWAALVPDRVGALVADGAEVVRLADASDDPYLRSWSRALWGHSLMLAGALDEASRRAAESAAIADETGQPGLRCLAHIFHADVLDAQGDHDEAERLTEGIRDLGQQSGFADAMMWYLGGMTLHWMFQGQPEISAAVAAQAFADYPRLVAWQTGWAFSLALAGETEIVAEFFTGVPDLLPTIPQDLLWVTAHFFLATVQGYGVENREAAAAVYERLLPYRGLHAAAGVVFYVGPVEMGLAVLARVLGNVETALAHHEAAAESIEACGAARARALNNQQWAVTLLARDGPGDRSRAAEMLRENLSYCRASRYGTLARWTEKFLAPVG